jgi:hypothetical protein
MGEFHTRRVAVESEQEGEKIGHHEKDQVEKHDRQTAVRQQ